MKIRGVSHLPLHFLALGGYSHWVGFPFIQLLVSRPLSQQGLSEALGRTKKKGSFFRRKAGPWLARGLLRDLPPFWEKLGVRKCGTSMFKPFNHKEVPRALLLVFVFLGLSSLRQGCSRVPIRQTNTKSSSHHQRPRPAAPSACFIRGHQCPVFTTSLPNVSQTIGVGTVHVDEIRFAA